MVQLIQSIIQNDTVILLIGRIKCSQILMSFECLMQNHKSLQYSTLQFSTHVQQPQALLNIETGALKLQDWTLQNWTD